MPARTRVKESRQKARRIVADDDPGLVSELHECTGLVFGVLDDPSPVGPGKRDDDADFHGVSGRGLESTACCIAAIANECLGQSRTKRGTQSYAAVLIRSPTAADRAAGTRSSCGPGDDGNHLRPRRLPGGGVRAAPDLCLRRGRIDSAP